ncbi:MAG: hypothetical protein RLZZ127_1034 [Planctomycetota bacterium]|jgi:hypothetical protein
MMPALRSTLLALAPTLALLAADAPGLAVWDAGQGTVGAEPGVRGAGVRPGASLVVGADGPARVVLPGTANGFLTLAAGSTVTLSERRVAGGGATAAELLVTIAAGAVAVGGDPAPRFVAVRLRGGASETVAAPGVGVAVEADPALGDTVAAIDGPVSTGPLPGAANGWQAVAERVVLEPRTLVVVDPRRGVGEPVPAPRRPQLAGAAASRAALRAVVAGTASATGAAAPVVTGWTLDQAARDLGLADPVWWSAPPAVPAQPGAAEPPPARSWSAMVQLSSFLDSNPGGVAADLGGGETDLGLSLYGDARWRCWSAGSYGLHLQAVGGLVRYQGERSVDGAGVAHDSRDEDQEQVGANAALVDQGRGLDWSLGVGGSLSSDGSQDLRIARLTGDVGGKMDKDVYAVLNLAWARGWVDPAAAGEDDYATRVVTARPALITAVPGAWPWTLEFSLLYTNSRSTAAGDDFYALRPGVSGSGRVGRIDLGLGLRGELIAYRAPRAATETDLARETVVNATATADWAATDWCSFGLFGNCLWFDSNQPLAAYSQTQVGVRTTLHW